MTVIRAPAVQALVGGAAIRVQGRTATTVVLDGAGSQTITLLKQNGSWKVAAVW